jgi:hypothetical protein
MSSVEIHHGTRDSAVIRFDQDAAARSVSLRKNPLDIEDGILRARGEHLGMPPQDTVLDVVERIVAKSRVRQCGSEHLLPRVRRNIREVVSTPRQRSR